ncbi:MAG: efflux RND transporter periplasmic adaptor subunit, partial [Deltaproteobacteria bacterium]|nr:efflux RND transporter periplasmic adaptor subunit [Deltaproteobacteria bacterium]
MTHNSLTPRPARRSGTPASRSSITLALASFLALALTGPGCGGPQADVPQDFAVPVEMAKAEIRPIRQVLDLVGSLEAKEAVMLKPEISGKVASIHFKEGEQIEEGALLVKLDDIETAASLREAEADLSFARAEYERRKDLFAKQVVSKQEMERTRAEMDRAAARVEVMKARLVKTSIKAPFSGTIGRRRVSPGAVVEPGDDLANFEVIDPLTLNFEVPERYLPGVRTGQPVKLKVVAFPDRDFEGTVYFINPRVSAASRSVTVKALVPNPELVLRAGMFANTQLVIEERDEAITVPEQS